MYTMDYPSATGCNCLLTRHVILWLASPGETGEEKRFDTKTENHV